MDDLLTRLRKLHEACDTWTEYNEYDMVCIEEAADAIERLRQLLKLVQSDAGNWLHSRLQDRIEAVVGPAAPYRALDDDGLPVSASDVQK